MPDMIRTDWDTYWLGVARAVAARGDCSRRQVGAVIIGPDNRLRGAGYNGSPPGGPSCLAGQCPRAAFGAQPHPDYADCVAIHAETNAIVDAGRRECMGGAIYVTDEPCSWCRKVIAAAGIERIVTL